MPNTLLLQVRNLNKKYGDKIIFEDANISINEKQKIGVIGRNGAGKSTFFKMIMGDEEIDSGVIDHLPELRLGYIPQVDPFEIHETVLEFLQRYTKREEWECATIAGQFGLKNELLTKKIGDLSGGYQMRVKLTSTLLFEPNLLLLDEPTNYLDLSTLLLLENFLKTFKGGFLCITHDREFLKKTCTSTMDVEQGQIVLHDEPLEAYLEYKDEKKRLAESVNKNIENKQKQLQTFVSRFGAKASMAKSAQSKLKQIDRLETDKIGIKNPLSTVKMSIPPIQTRSGIGLTLEKLSIGYGTKTIASNINLLIEKGKKIAILGDNGQGKSTLLKTIASSIPLLAGQMNWAKELKIAYYAQHVNQALDPEQTIEQYLRQEAISGLGDDIIFRMMSNFLFKQGDTQKKIDVLSGGEKARLCLAGMFLTQSDVLLLDEPTNHLDFETVEVMGQALNEFNGTVFVISHDRTFVNLVADEIWEVGNGSVKRVLGTYQDYVWAKEQEITNSAKVTNEGKDPFAKPTKELDKATRVKLFTLNKDLTKIERKIENLKAKLNDNWEQKTKDELETCENKWLELTQEIEQLQN